MKYYYSFDFFSTIENVKIILSLKVVQKQVVGWLWPMGHNLPTPDINKYLNIFKVFLPFQS